MLHPTLYIDEYEVLTFLGLHRLTVLPVSPGLALELFQELIHCLRRRPRSLTSRSVSQPLYLRKQTSVPYSGLSHFLRRDPTEHAALQSCYC